MIAATIYFCLLILPPTLFIVRVLQRGKHSRFMEIGCAASLLSVPAYVVLPCYLLGLIWPPDLLAPDPATHVSIDVPGYQVAFIQNIGGPTEYETYFQVTRPDGKQALFLIDIDAQKCWQPKVEREGSRVYVLCSGEAPSERASYVDSVQMIVHSGYYGTDETISSLDFEK